MIARHRIERRGGTTRLRLPKGERQLLEHLALELAARYEEGEAADDLHRLFPPAYEEEGSESEYRLMMHRELLDGRRRSVRVFEETLERDELSDEELETWLGVLNDLRLVLGTRLDVTEETFSTWVNPRDPSARELALYAYLSALQEEAVAAATGGRFGKR